MIDRTNDFDLINESLARGKSLVKESLDLTRKNEERKREIERHLKNCFTIESSIKNSDNSFTLELENHYMPTMPKNKSFEIYHDLITQSDPKEKISNEKLEKVIKERNYAQQKLGEIQDFVKDLEEQNMSLKSKVKLLVGQITNSGEYGSRILSLEQEVKCLQLDNEKLQFENRNFAELAKILKDENRSLKARLPDQFDKGKSTPTSTKPLIPASSELSYEEPQTSELRIENSTENYTQYLKKMKNEVFSHRKPPLGCQDHPNSQRYQLANANQENQPKKSASSRENFMKDRIKNENIVERLEEKYIKTDEKFQKLTTHLNYHEKANSQKKLSVSLDGIALNGNKPIDHKLKNAIKSKNKKRVGSKSKKLKKNKG